MVRVPAFCDNCGNVFPSGYNFENSFNVTMTNCKEQCPKCNYMARIPDGVFNFYKNGIEVLQATEETIKDLQKLYVIIQNASKVEATPQDITEKVEKEVPKLSFLAKYLPQNAKELGVYLNVIATLILGMGGTVEVKPNIEINRTEINQQFNVQQTYQQMVPALEVHKPFKLPDEKIGRNEPCPCNSGLKYKYCHGK